MSFSNAASLLLLLAAPVWAGPCPPGDNSCGRWAPGGVGGVRWVPNERADDKTPAPKTLDPYPDVILEPEADNHHAPPVEERLKSQGPTNAEKRARRIEIDKQMTEKALTQGVIIENREDLTNFRLCERGRKDACALIRYEKDAEAGEHGAHAAHGGAGKTRRNADGSKMTAADAQKADAAATAALTERAGGAMTRASAAGNQLKMQRDDDLPGGPSGGQPGGRAGGGTAASAAGGFEGKRAGAGNVARGTVGGTVGGADGNASGGSPERGLDLDAAAASGFGASFAAEGLKMGSGSTAGKVLRSDGKLASPEEIASLRRRIASDPKALMRRPDMLEVIDRKRLDRLKNEFHTKPAEKERAFKDIGVTPDNRDFVHTRSCNTKLEKDCNKLIDKPYRKGVDVTPEDLDVIDDGLHPEDDDEDEAEDEEGEEESEDGSVAAERSKGRTAAEIIAADDERRASRAKRRRLRSLARLSGHGSAETPPTPDSSNEGVPPAPSPWPTIVVILAAVAAAGGAWLRRRRAALEEETPP